MASVTEMKEITLDVNYSDLEILHKVETNCGTVHVHVVGEPSNKKLFPLVTLHDYAFNHKSQFHSFQKSGEEAIDVLSNFVTYHIDLPGQEDKAGVYEQEYPSMDDLSGIIAHVRTALNIEQPIVLLGVGAGGNIALRYMIKHPKTVRGAVLIDVTNDTETWTKWAQNKITDAVTRPTELFRIREFEGVDAANFLLERHYGRTKPVNCMVDDSRRYLLDYMISNCNTGNQMKFYNSYAQRNILTSEEMKIKQQCPILMISGRQSWKNDACIDLRAELQEAGRVVNLIEPSPCYIMPLEEAPRKILISMLLYLQGIGLCLNMGLPKAHSVSDAYTKPEVEHRPMVV